MDMEKIFSEGIRAFIPVYLDMKGNCTLLLTGLGKEYEMERTVKTILNLISQFYLVDLKATKKYYGNLLNVKNLIPIPFNVDDVFIPVKVRKPVCKNDGSFGYVNINYIDRVYRKENKTLIQLTDGYIIESLSSIDTVNKHVKNGHIVKRLVKEREHITVIRESSLLNEYEKPATKQDIALLINEILKIQANLK